MDGAGWLKYFVAWALLAKERVLYVPNVKSS